MTKDFRIRTVLLSAVIIGLFVGVALAFAQYGATRNDGGTDTAKDASSAELDPKNLPVEVLKALPPEELAEMFPEKAEGILNPDSSSQVKSTGGDSNDPAYLRAVIQKLGGEAPEGATTKELQDMLANLSTGSGATGKK